MTARLRWGLGLVSVGVAWLPQLRAQGLELEHTAPYLGSTLTLSIEGATADTPVVLLESPEAGFESTPFGALELERSTITLAALGRTDSAGQFEVDIAIALDASLAETALHYQALIGNRLTAAGAELSSAAHLRRVGPRVFTGWRGGSASPNGVVPGGMQIVSAVSDQIVAGWNYAQVQAVGLASGDGRPVFRHNLAHGAVVPSPQRLVVFDPFFGELLGTIALEEASRTLWTDRAEELAFVLETGLAAHGDSQPARLLVLDLASAQIVETTSLGRTASGHWCVDELHERAFIAEFDDSAGALGRTVVRVFDLRSRETLGELRVGLPESDRFTDMACADGQLFVTTRSPDLGIFEHGEFTRIDLRSDPPRVTVDPGYRRPSQLLPVPDAGALLFFDLDSFVPSTALYQTRLGGASLVSTVRGTFFYLFVTAMCASGTDVWVIDAGGNEPPGGTEPGRLYLLDLPTQSWTPYPHLWPPFDVGPLALELVEDALVQKVYVASRGVDPPIDIAPEVFVIDRATGAESVLPVGPEPDVLAGFGLAE